MDSLLEFYEDYGRALAGRVLVGSGGPALGFVLVEEMGDPSEVLAAISKPGPASVLLVWEQFGEDVSDGGRDNYHTNLTASVAVITKAQDRLGKREARAIGRKAVLEVLGLMIGDGYQGELNAVGIQVGVRRLPLSPVGPVGTNWYGYGLEFSWTVPLDLTLPD